MCVHACCVYGLCCVRYVCGVTCGAVSGIEMDRYTQTDLFKLELFFMNIDNFIYNDIHCYIYTHTITVTISHIHLQKDRYTGNLQDEQERETQTIC